MADKKEISLLPDSENPKSFRSKFFRWVTTTGRVTIIITELIVISVFISRFWLDRKNSDLSEVIRQKEAILESAAPFEVEFTGLQQRLSYIKTFYSAQPEYKDQLQSLVSSTPTDLFYEKIIISTDEENDTTNITASLAAYQEDSIVAFINNLMLNPQIDQVNITKIEKSEKENKYSISLVLYFNKSTSVSSI